jgi:hypothetical protein
MYLRIKSKIRKTINIKPIYIKLPKTIEINNDIHTVKQVTHEKSLRKNLVLNDFVKDLLTNKYSI